MTKSDLIERLCQDQKLPKGKAELLVNTIFECLEESLRRGERIEIRGFGSFEIRAYKSYQGRNPKTGVPVSVKEKRLPFFKVGKELKERVNGVESPPPSGNGNGNGNGNGSPGGLGGGGTGTGGGHAQPRGSMSADGEAAAPETTVVARGASARE
jgi:integration host factor subunit beta